ncbi:MAG TPA: GerMN domain-containing protein [Pyrinomonadaceae bacterium]|nr:GerMN domain-containing protein [Pyrinomonadaceae bacterium]
MKIKRVIVMLTAALTLSGLCLGASAQGAKSARTMEVQVYFLKEGDSADPDKNPWNLQPVARRVSAGAPLRPTIEALLKGPTAQERGQGLGALDVNGIYIVKVAVKGGTAYASFAHRKGTSWLGDLTPATFGDAVERTMKQFPNVRRTVICVDGVTNYGDESGDPDKPCPRF